MGYDIVGTDSALIGGAVRTLNSKPYATAYEAVQDAARFLLTSPSAATTAGCKVISVDGDRILSINHVALCGDSGKSEVWLTVNQGADLLPEEKIGNGDFQVHTGIRPAVQQAMDFQKFLDSIFGLDMDSDDLDSENPWDDVDDDADSVFSEE